MISDSIPNSEQIVIPNVSHDDFKSGTFFTSKVMELNFLQDIISYSKNRLSVIDVVLQR